MKLFHLCYFSSLVESRPSVQFPGESVPVIKQPELNEKVKNFFENASKSGTTESTDKKLAVEAGVFVALNRLDTILTEAHLDLERKQQILDEGLENALNYISSVDEEFNRADQYFLTFFGEVGMGQYVPRRLTVDVEPLGQYYHKL